MPDPDTASYQLVPVAGREQSDRLLRSATRTFLARLTRDLMAAAL